MPVLQLADTLQPLNSTKACGCCVKKFNALRGKQHCSFCGNVVCKSCTRDAAGMVPPKRSSSNSKRGNNTNDANNQLAAAALAAQSVVVVKKQCTDCQAKARDFKVQSARGNGGGPTAAKITAGRGTKSRGYGTNNEGASSSVLAKTGIHGTAKFSLLETIQHLLGSDPSATLSLDQNALPPATLSSSSG